MSKRHGPFNGQNLSDLSTRFRSAKLPEAFTPFQKRLSKVLMALSLVYAVFPVDFIPDTLPILGYLDDAGLVLSAGLNLWEKYSTRGTWILTFVKYFKWIVLALTILFALVVISLIALGIWAIS